MKWVRIIGALVLIVAALGCFIHSSDQFRFAKNADGYAEEAKRFMDPAIWEIRKERMPRSPEEFRQQMYDDLKHAEECRKSGRFFLGIGSASFLAGVSLIVWQKFRKQPYVGQLDGASKEDTAGLTGRREGD
jgi:hypothetical protein